MPAPQYISHSQLQTLRTCGEQYRLQYIEGVERQPSTAAVGGTVIHAVTETIDQQLLQGVNDAPTLIEAASVEAQLVIEKELAHVAEKSPSYTDPATWLSYGQGGYQNLDWYTENAIPSAIANFIIWRQSLPNWQPVMLDDGPAIEWPFIVPFRGRELRGVIDRIYVDTETGVAIVIDIKSGAKPKNTTQLGRYGYAVRTLLPELNVRWGSYLYNLKQPEGAKAKPTLMPAVDLNWWTDARLARFDSAALEMLRLQLFVPSPGEACFHCGVKANCEFFEASL